MDEHNSTRLWLMRALFIWLGLFVIYGRLMPVQNPAGPWGAPDLLLALTFAWALRRPDLATIWSIAAVWLLADFLLLRPPGLLTALVLTAVLLLQQRERDIARMPFLVEWLMVSVVILAIVLIDRIVLSFLLVPLPPTGQGVIQVIVTALTYPPVVFVSRYLFRVRRATPGEAANPGRFT